MTAKNDDYFHLGLTDQEVLQSREKHGVNLLTPPKRPSLLKLYLEKFEDPVVRVLLVAAVFSLIISIIENEYADAHLETFIVVDGTTGQNALVQARQFSEVTDITGVILTKLDGTAKGGIAIAIQSELGIPVKYIGIGEGIEDLQKFDADAFVDALFE